MRQPLNVSLFTTTLLLALTPLLFPNSGRTQGHIDVNSPNRQRLKSLANSESPLKRTEELMSPLKWTWALRQGFKPLPDYGFYLKLMPTTGALPLRVLAQASTTANGTEVDKLFQEGVQQYRQGYYPKALATYQRVLEIRQQQNDKAGIGQTLNNMGEVYLGLTQADKASEVLQQALAIRRELKDRKGEGETLNNLGSVYLLKSQYDKALETLQQALGCVIN